MFLDCPVVTFVQCSVPAERSMGTMDAKDTEPKRQRRREQGAEGVEVVGHGEGVLFSPAD